MTFSNKDFSEFDEKLSKTQQYIHEIDKPAQAVSNLP